MHPRRGSIPNQQRSVAVDVVEVRIVGMGVNQVRMAVDMGMGFAGRIIG